MKQLIYALVFLIPAAAHAGTFEKNLSIGAQGEEVKNVQQFLQAKGYLAVAPTGYYGAMTKKAVATFQKEQKLPASGLWFSRTRAAANTIVLGATTQVEANSASSSQSLTSAGEEDKEIRTPITTAVTSGTSALPALLPAFLQRDTISFIKNNYAAHTEYAETVRLAEKVLKYIQDGDKQSPLYKKIYAVLQKIKELEDSMSRDMMSLANSESVSFGSQITRMAQIVQEYKEKNKVLYDELSLLMKSI